MTNLLSIKSKRIRKKSRMKKTKRLLLKSRIKPHLMSKKGRIKLPMIREKLLMERVKKLPQKRRKMRKRMVMMNKWLRRNKNRIRRWRRIRNSDRQIFLSIYILAMH